MLGSAVSIAVLLSACGGGGAGPSSTDSTSSAAAVAEPVATDFATILGSPSQTDIVMRTGRVPSLTVRAYGKLAQNVGPRMEVRVDGVAIGSQEVRAAQHQDYVFSAPSLRVGSRVDIVFSNHTVSAGQDRELVVGYVSDGTGYMAPSQPGVTFDAGSGAGAVDGQNVSPGMETLRNSGALRFTWPAAADASLMARRMAGSRFLQQASFGPTRSQIERFQTITPAAWVDEQIAIPAVAEFVAYVQGKYDRGVDFRPPNGSQYTPAWVEQKFWAGAAVGQDQLRKRVAFALHEIFVVSQADSNLFHQSRAYAAYLDSLNRLAFSNFRALIEEVALSPAMGIYLSHMRNRKEDAASNRLPDENFARELMQLFTIGLHELNADGSEKLDASGKPIETYNNSDVMAMAKVFTGWSWGYDDNQLTESNFVWGTPESNIAGTSRADIRRMKPYPGMASTAEKRLFQGRTTAVTIPANTTPTESVRLALDALFKHPNVGPFIGKQLIQRLVTSNPSRAYVGRVAQAFNNNGSGVRGDMAAVVRAVLLDTEARSAASGNFGKVREPILRMTHWMRAFNARSASNEFMVIAEPHGLGQRANYMPSVFGYFRPGYVPPNTSLADAGLMAPEMQIVDESTTANWINGLDVMLYEGLGWFGSNRDVTVDMAAEMSLLATAPAALLDHLNLMLFAGQMSPSLKKNIMDAMQGVHDSSNNRNLWRARAAVYVAMTSPEYLVQR